MHQKMATLQHLGLNLQNTKQRLKQNKMQVNLPSPQQIYDFSTEQLTKLKTQLQVDIKRKQQINKVTDEIQSLQELLQNIALEIQERKTIEFFTQLCINDGTANKYVKEITDFNNEFKKLANQLLNNQSSPHMEENNKDMKNRCGSSRDQTQNQRPPSNLTNNQHDKLQLNRGSSQTTITSQDLINQNHTHPTQTSDFSSASIDKMAGKTISKKMGVGQSSMKKNKNSMQDFIKATLAKSKAVEYVSTKGGQIKKSPDQLLKNASHLNTNHPQGSRTPLSTTKSIKPPSQGSDTGSHRSQTKRSSQSSSKNIPIQSNKPISEKNNRQTLIKKRNDVIEKIKTMKKPQNNSKTQGHPPQPPKKKNARGMDAKSMVEMVKQEEESKKKRQQEQIQAIKKPKQQIKSKKEQIKQKNEQVKQEKLSQNFSTMQKVQQIQSKTQKQIKGQDKFKSSINVQKENDFPIKEQINAILSSSDTESDTDSAKLSSNKRVKKGSHKQLIKKDQTYCPIPQQQIEESIAIVKETKLVDKKISTLVEDKKVLKKQSSNNRQNFQQKINQRSETKQIKQIQGYQQLKQVQKNTNELFGKITEEEFNPYGYDDEQDQHSSQEKVEENKQQTFEEQEDQNQNQSQKEETTYISNNQQKLSLVKKQQTKSSFKNLSKNNKQEKALKRKVSNQLSVTPSPQDFQSNRMYNEEYWLHIKEQAEAKIQRFKQEKQLERKERDMKTRMIEQESKRIKAQIQGKINKRDKKSGQDQNQSTSDISENNIVEEKETMQLMSESDVNDKFIKQQKDNLKKIYAENNINGTKKMLKKPAVSSIIKQPKPSYPRPQFNYLQFYPTFNHIFNVSYTKTEGQAVLDIPIIMKELIEMFQTHIEYQKSRKNNFRPAIFLPFDNRNSKINQYSDARQLLQHAETTYINLKTLIERVEIFNSNIQGEFQNCSDEQRQKTQFYRVVKTREEVYDIISTSFLRRKGWKQLPHGQNLKANWNLFWSWSKPEIDMNKLLIFQRINHYPFNKNLSRKDLLYKNIDIFRKTHKVPFPYLPITYNLPKEFTQFSKKFHQEQLINREKNYWIMKPIGKSRGRGIKLINSLGDLNYLDNIVVQKYIANPLLIEGYKFDMRIYVLVTSFHPLEAFVYREGFARLSTQKYSLQPIDMKNNYVHLTNFAINKQNKEAGDQFTQGSKISLKSLKQKVTKMGYSFASVWSQVHQIIIKSLLACSVSVPPFPAAFQLFGYDIMIDDTGQCSLIEINSSPSLERSYMIDQVIKQSLIDDIIEIVKPPNFSKQEAINVMSERLAPDFRNTKKSTQKGASHDEEDLIHIARILKYQKFRRYGEMPQKIGLFEMVAPSPTSKQLQKLIKSKSGINAPHNID